MTERRAARFAAFVGDAQHAVALEPLEDGRWRVTVDGRVFFDRTTGLPLLCEAGTSGSCPTYRVVFTIVR